jgi:hypothetical protein
MRRGEENRGAAEGAASLESQAGVPFPLSPRLPKTKTHHDGHGLAGFAVTVVLLAGQGLWLEWRGACV